MRSKTQRRQTKSERLLHENFLFGETIKVLDALMSLGWTIRSLANKTGVSTTTLYKWKKRETLNPNSRTLQIIWIAFDITVNLIIPHLPHRK